MRRMAFRPAGYRRSIEKRLTEKREASAFIDVTTAEDSGKFPDMNVANALQRVPGVVNTADGGEGSGVPPRPSNFLPLPSINKQKTFGLLVGGVWQVCINRELRNASETWLWRSDRVAQGNVLKPTTNVGGTTFVNKDAISSRPG
jgi:hypothetical protein